MPWMRAVPFSDAARVPARYADSPRDSRGGRVCEQRLNFLRGGYAFDSGSPNI
jgi:hypothetical protein